MFLKSSTLKHLQNIANFPRLCRGCKMFYLRVTILCKTFLQMFILCVTTSYLQHVFNVLKHLQKCFANVLQHFCKCFSVKHLQNILEVVTCKIKHFCKCFANVLHVTTVLRLGKTLFGSILDR